MSKENAAFDPPITIEHAGSLEDREEIARYLLPLDGATGFEAGLYSCCFCGVGDSGRLLPKKDATEASTPAAPLVGEGVLKLEIHGRPVEVPVTVADDGVIEVRSAVPLTAPGGTIQGQLVVGGESAHVTARERSGTAGDGKPYQFVPYRKTARKTESVISKTSPTAGCVKLAISHMRQKPAFPVHVQPSVRAAEGEGRQAISYKEAITRLADLVLEHRGTGGRTLVYACGQIDYFAIFAMQEVFRILGVRNLTGNAEHCLNAGAVHNEILTGQEGPFLTVAQGIEGPNRFYLLNGWNGFITHPPAFRAIVKQPDFDGYLIEVMVSESAKAIERKLDQDRVLLIRPRTDPHLALSVAHEILARYPDAIEERFVERFADRESYVRFVELAESSRFDPARVAERIAPEPQYAERLLKGIKGIAYKLTRAELIPINIPSVGLSQTSGVVAHCLWGNVLAMIGKFGLNPDGTPAGGTLRLPGQINAESEVQGLSRKYFMGRIPFDRADDAASRMGLTEDAYAMAREDEPRAALDYSDDADVPELFLCFGTQFEANMMGRSRWLEKLARADTSLVVIDPIPDPYSVENADLIVPSPPHSATTKLYQNGEWKLSLSTPQKRAAPETRTDATIVYDLMAEVTRRLMEDPAVAADHPDLARLASSGYLAERFSPPTDGSPGGLPRIEGEVSRALLFQRVQDYMSGGCGPLYCRPEHDDGTPIRWEELLEEGSIIYGGVGTRRFVLDYDDPAAEPFQDIFRQRNDFRFFVATEEDLSFPQGTILNSGRSPLSDDRDLIRFATSTFNSGKATPIVDMPDENPLNISESLAERYALRTDDWVTVTERHSGSTVELPVVVTDRVKGDTVYCSFHKNGAQLRDGRYINTATSHKPRCSYCAQTRVKATEVSLAKVEVATDDQRRRVLPIDTTAIDPKLDLPIWQGQSTPLYVTDIVEETHDVYTFRFQGDPLCRFVYWPGQFCTLVLKINGQKVVRSYTISSTPTRPFVLEVTVKRVPGGLVSNWLPDNLKVGDRVDISGPRGKFCLVPGKIQPKLLFLGAGSGITPLMSMARWLYDVSANIDLLFFNSVRTPEDIIYDKEIDLLTSRYRMFSPVVVTTTRGASGPTGLSGRLDRAMLEQVAPDLNERHVYSCGPEGFTECVKGVLAELDFDPANFHTESFGGARTSVADKATPVSPTHAGGTVDTADRGVGPPAGNIEVQFAKSGTVAKTDGAMVLLDLAEAHDIDLDYGCRTGSCGECKCRVLEGEVDSDCDAGLEPEEKAAGYVLTCVTRPRGNCTLDA